MSFINKSVNFSQTTLLKTEHLKNYLTDVNEYILKTNDYIVKNKTKNLPTVNYHIIPNNGIKYYLFITKKNRIETSNDNYNFLYFFPDSHNNLTDPKLQANTISDFFMEIDNRFDSEYLFEGYLYKNDTLYNKYTYLLTDIYAQDREIIKCDYNLRFTLINEIIQNINSNLKHLNEHLTIGIHPIFNTENEGMVHIFMNNFVFKEQITSIEHVFDHFHKKRFVKNETLEFSKTIVHKKITKGKYADIYNVYNTDTGDYEGILYIKGIKESRQLKDLIRNKENIVLPCKYNISFNKWQPCVN